mmetsp:Transcript_15802/g.43193  ORF Transcript_15802/g.43193 Transcript_15802/m.43193 type:complete len:361 (+) Transcript_15802:166-1248(+)
MTWESPAPCERFDVAYGATAVEPQDSPHVRYAAAALADAVTAIRSQLGRQRGFPEGCMVLSSTSFGSVAAGADTAGLQLTPAATHQRAVYLQPCLRRRRDEAPAGESFDRTPDLLDERSPRTPDAACGLPRHAPHKSMEEHEAPAFRAEGRHEAPEMTEARPAAGFVDGECLQPTRAERLAAAQELRSIVSAAVRRHTEARVDAIGTACREAVQAEAERGRAMLSELQTSRRSAAARIAQVRAQCMYSAAAAETSVLGASSAANCEAALVAENAAGREEEELRSALAALEDLRREAHEESMQLEAKAAGAAAGCCEARQAGLEAERRIRQQSGALLQALASPPSRATTAEVVAPSKTADA